MKTYLVEYSTPFEKYGDDEWNEVRECVARNGYQVGDFDPRRETLEIDATLTPGTRLHFRNTSIEILA